MSKHAETNRLTDAPSRVDGLLRVDNLPTRKHLGPHFFSLHFPDSRFGFRRCTCTTGTGHR